MVLAIYSCPTQVPPASKQCIALWPNPSLELFHRCSTWSPTNARICLGGTRTPPSSASFQHLLLLLLIPRLPLVPLLFCSAALYFCVVRLRRTVVLGWTEGLAPTRLPWEVLLAARGHEPTLNLSITILGLMRVDYRCSCCWWDSADLDWGRWGPLCLKCEEKAALLVSAWDIMKASRLGVRSNVSNLSDCGSWEQPRSMCIHRDASCW